MLVTTLTGVRVVAELSAAFSLATLSFCVRFSSRPSLFGLTFFFLTYYFTYGYAPLCNQFLSSWQALPNSTNFIFLFILFLALTPVFYASPLKANSDLSLHFSLFFCIFLSAFVFLTTINFYALLFFYELLVIPVFFFVKTFWTLL